MMKIRYSFLPSNPTVEDNLKKWAEAAGINKHLTFTPPDILMQLCAYVRGRSIHG